MKIKKKTFIKIFTNVVVMQLDDQILIFEKNQTENRSFNKIIHARPPCKYKYLFKI